MTCKAERAAKLWTVLDTRLLTERETLTIAEAAIIYWTQDQLQIIMTTKQEQHHAGI